MQLKIIWCTRIIKRTIINISERLTVFNRNGSYIRFMLILIWYQFIQINYVGKKER